MLFLLILLIIVPSAIGLYYLLKPPNYPDTEMNTQLVTHITHYKTVEDNPLTTVAPAAILRKRT